MFDMVKSFTVYCLLVTIFKGKLSDLSVANETVGSLYSGAAGILAVT